MFSWVLIIVLKNNVFLMKDGGGGGAFAQNFRNHITVYSLRSFAIIYYYFEVSSPIDKKNTSYFAEK